MSILLTILAISHSVLSKAYLQVALLYVSDILHHHCGSCILLGHECCEYRVLYADWSLACGSILHALELSESLLVLRPGHRCG